MSIHEHLERSLDRIDDAGPDLPRLTALARRRGLWLRRRRKAAGVGGTLAALGVAATVAVSLGLGPGTPQKGDTAAGRPATDPIPTVIPVLGGPRAAVTGPAAVLALDWAVTRQRSGAAYDPAGQLSETSGDLYVQLLWKDADDLGVSVVGLNLQHGRGMFAGCGPAHPEKLDCRARRLPDGSRLVTYHEANPTNGGIGRRFVADLYRSDRIRVVATSSNGLEHSHGRWTLTRAEPPLTTGDLAALVRQPVWDDSVPVAFTHSATSLDGYRDLDHQAGWEH